MNTQTLAVALNHGDADARASAVRTIRTALINNQNSIVRAASALGMAASTLRAWTRKHPALVAGITLRPRGFPAGWKRERRNGPAIRPEPGAS